MSRSKPSQEPFKQDNGHSTREIEHRFTELEIKHQASREDRDELFSIAEKHTDKLTLHERILLGLLIAFATLVQDRLPYVAHFIKALIGS
jgi:hypothetical protein